MAHLETTWVQKALKQCYSKCLFRMQANYIQFGQNCRGKRKRNSILVYGSIGGNICIGKWTRIPSDMDTSISISLSSKSPFAMDTSAYNTDNALLFHQPEILVYIFFNFVYNIISIFRKLREKQYEKDFRIERTATNPLSSACYFLSSTPLSCEIN